MSLEGLGFAGEYDFDEDPGYAYLLKSFSLPGVAEQFYFVLRSRMLLSCLCRPP